MKKLIFQSYMQTIRNSLGSLLFRNYYCQDEQGNKVDVLENGNLGCAIFVTSILAMFGVIDRRHATVEGTVQALPLAGWRKLDQGNPVEGDLLVWEKFANPNGEEHAHIGFYMGGDLAISNSSENGFPILHHFSYQGKRVVSQIFRYDWSALEAAQKTS